MGERSDPAARGTRGAEERERRKRGAAERAAAGRRKGARSEIKKRTEAGAAAKKGAQRPTGRRAKRRGGILAADPAEGYRSPRRERSDRSPKRSGGRDRRERGDEGGRGGGPTPEVRAGRGTPRETRERSGAHGRTRPMKTPARLTKRASPRDEGTTR